MSVLELKTEIERKAEEEVSRILQNAREEAEKIVSEANAKQVALRDEKSKTLMRALDTEAMAELAVSRMNRKGELLQLKSGWADRVFEEARKRITEMAEKSGSEYREYLRKLILEGISKIKGNKLIVEANARDVEVVKKELKTILEGGAKIKNEKIELKLKAQSGMSGGVIVSTEDMTKYYNNTLEARLSYAQQNLSGEVYKILFKMGE